MVSNPTLEHTCNYPTLSHAMYLNAVVDYQSIHCMTWSQHNIGMCKVWHIIALAEA